MAITPETVDEKRFSPVRKKEGYDMEEVDNFLDEITVALRGYENELRESKEALELVAPMMEENVRLKEQLEEANAALQAAEGQNVILRARLEEAESSLTTMPPPVPGVEWAPEPEMAPEMAEESAGAPPVDDSSWLSNISTTAEASAATSRLLEIAVETSERLVGEANNQADEVRSAAQSEAEFILTKAEQDAGEMLRAAHAEKDAVEEIVESLKSFESAYRESLTEYFSAQLDAVREVNVLAAVEETNPVAEVPEAVADSYDLSEQVEDAVAEGMPEPVAVADDLAGEEVAEDAPAVAEEWGAGEAEVVAENTEDSPTFGDGSADRGGW